MNQKTTHSAEMSKSILFREKFPVDLCSCMNLSLKSHKSSLKLFAFLCELLLKAETFNGFFLDSKQELPLCAARNPGSGIFDIEVLNVDEEILKLYSGLCWIEFYKIHLIYFFAFLKILLHASKIRFDFTLV